MALWEIAKRPRVKLHLMCIGAYYVNYRSFTVYGSFAAGFIALAVFAGISWYADRTTDGSDDHNQPAVLSRGIRISVYLITSALATTSALISLVDVDDDALIVTPVSLLCMVIYIINYYIKCRCLFSPGLCTFSSTCFACGLGTSPSWFYPQILRYDTIDLFCACCILSSTGY